MEEVYNCNSWIINIVVLGNISLREALASIPSIVFRNAKPPLTTSRCRLDLALSPSSSPIICKRCCRSNWPFPRPPVHLQRRTRETADSH